MSKKIKNIFFLFGVVAIFIMFVTTDLTWNEIWHSIHKIKEWICVIFLLWVLLYMMNALTWRIILKGNGCCNISFLKLLKITISGFALNYATPAGLMGGEPYKIFELVPYVGRERATSSVLLFSMMHIFAHFCFWFTSHQQYTQQNNCKIKSFHIEINVKIQSHKNNNYQHIEKIF